MVALYFGHHSFVRTKGDFHGSRWKDKTIGFDFEDESIYDSHGEWKQYPKSGAFAQFRFELDFSTQLFDVLFDDIYANAASGDIGDFRSSGESGSEDELVDFFVGKLTFFANDSIFNRFLENSFRIDSASVIGEFYSNAAALVVGFGRDATGIVFVRLGPFARIFESVVEGVANHVDERIADFFDYVTIELGFIA